jgi:hypothetical protein
MCASSQVNAEQVLFDEGSSFANPCLSIIAILQGWQPAGLISASPGLLSKGKAPASD